MNRKVVRWVGLAVAALVIIVALAAHLGGNSPASQVSKYYREGYSAGGKFSDGGGDNVTTNVYCTDMWNQDSDTRGGSANLGGQQIEDYDSGWVAACEDAPLGQSGLDVPGSGLGPSNSQEPYSPTEGQ